MDLKKSLLSPQVTSRQMLKIPIDNHVAFQRLHISGTGNPAD
jgi:hypothetical protein